MGDVSAIVNVAITANSQTPTKPSFGIEEILAYHTHWLDKFRTYTSLAGMVADGFSTTEPAYLLATMVVNQNPRPPSFKVCRGTTAVAQVFTLNVTANTTGIPVGLSILDSSGVTHDLFHTPASESAASVATALAIVIAAVSGVASASVSASTLITVTLTTAGQTWYPTLTPNNSATFIGGIQGCSFTDTTPSASVATDLTNLLTVDKVFYGVTTQYIDATNIAAGAAWGLANKRIFAYVTADEANHTGTTGIMATLKGLSNNYAIGFMTRNPGASVTAGLMAQRFTADPGTDTWDAKTVKGALPDDWMTPTDTGYIQGNNGNYYSTTAGLQVTTDGRAADGSYMDQTRGIDSMSSDIQLAVFGDIASSEKVPYTQKGIDRLGGDVAGVLANYTASASQENRLLSNDVGVSPVVLPPSISTVTTADKKSRILRNLNFTCTAAGAIQTVSIVGTVSF